MKTLGEQHKNPSCLKTKKGWLLAIGLIFTFTMSSCSTAMFDGWFSGEKEKTVKLNLKIAESLSPKGLEKFRKIVRASPVIYKEYVLVADSNVGIHAFYVGKDYNLTSTQFRKAWTFEIPNGVESTFAVVNHRAFIGASDGYFYSLDLEKREVVWKFQVKSEVLSRPVLDDDGHVYFLSGNNIFYCLDAGDGRQIWAYSRQDTANMTVRGGASAAFDKDRLYVGFSDGSLVALSISSGAPLWEIQLNKNKRFRDIDATVVVEGESIYVSTYDDKIYSLKKTDGSTIWRYDNGGGASDLSLLGDYIYAPLTNNTVVKLDKKTGKEVWKIDKLSGTPTAITLKNDFAIFGESKGDLRIHRQSDGKLVKKFEPGRGVFSKPTLDRNNNIYFVSNESVFYGLEFKDELDHYYKNVFK